MKSQKELYDMLLGEIKSIGMNVDSIKEISQKQDGLHYKESNKEFTYGEIKFEGIYEAFFYIT